MPLKIAVARVVSGVRRRRSRLVCGGKEEE